jgi:hypothetical protein
MQQRPGSRRRRAHSSKTARFQPARPGPLVRRSRPSVRVPTARRSRLKRATMRFPAPHRRRPRPTRSFLMFRRSSAHPLRPGQRAGPRPRCSRHWPREAACRRRHPRRWFLRRCRPRRPRSRSWRVRQPLRRMLPPTDRRRTCRHRTLSRHPISSRRTCLRLLRRLPRSHPSTVRRTHPCTPRRPTRIAMRTATPAMGTPCRRQTMPTATLMSCPIRKTRSARRPSRLPRTTNRHLRHLRHLRRLRRRLRLRLRRRPPTTGPLRRPRDVHRHGRSALAAGRDQPAHPSGQATRHPSGLSRQAREGRRRAWPRPRHDGGSAGNGRQRK